MKPASAAGLAIALALSLFAGPAIASVPAGQGLSGLMEAGSDKEIFASASTGYHSPDGGPPLIQANSSGSSVATSHEAPPEPTLSYIDNVCGMLVDSQVRVRESVFSSEISGCLLGYRPEQVAQAPRGRGPRAPQPPGPGRIIDRVIELVAAPELDIAPGEIGLTGLETYVWIDEPAPVSVSAAAGGTTVDARAFPSQYL